LTKEICALEILILTNGANSFNIKSAVIVQQAVLELILY